MSMIPVQQGYKLVVAHYEDKLEEEVNKLMQEGWQCHGAPFLTSSSLEYVQAMIMLGFATLAQRSRIAVPGQVAIDGSKLK
jgi:hypothetical protein